MPCPAGNLPTRRTAAGSFFGRRFAFASAAASARGAVARAAIRTAVLLVAVDEIRNLIVDGNVVELGNRKLHTVPGPATIDRDAEAAVVRDGQTITVGRIDPQVVIVP